MAITAGEAVSARAMAQLKILGTFLARYSAFEAWAITAVLNAKTDSLLDVTLAQGWDNLVVLPTVDAATPSGYQTEQALNYFENKNLLSDITDVLKAVRDYARAKELSKRGTRNLLRAVIRPEDRIIERIPDELMALTGPGKPKLKVPRFPFVERGMTIHDRLDFASQTAATSVQAWKVRQEAEREGADLRWVTMRDNRVRPAHVHAQGQTVAYDEPFSVGGYPMWFPGDPSAPEELTINCRCVLATVAPPNRRYVQNYIPPEWMNASGGLPGMSPSQARAPKGTRIGGQWIDTPGAILRSLNRLRHGSDLSPDAAPTDLDAADAERTRLADEVLAREGRPGVEEIADRLAAIYDRTTPEQRAAGEKWYDEARALAQEMADNPNTDLTEEQAAAIIAHLSTQTRWEANAEYARSLANGLTQDEALAHLREEVLAGRIAKPKQGGDFIYDDNWQKALNASVSGDPIGFGNLGTFSEANKTRTFAGNILGDKDGVTVDVWMQRLLGQSLLIPAGGPQLKFPDPKTGKLKVFSKDKREDQIYESLSQALRVAAKKRGISPREMQAITWGWGLANYTQARKGHPGRFIDGDLVLPDVIGGEQALIDSGDLVAGAVYMPEPRPLPLADQPMPDYHYAQAERLLGLARQTAPEFDAPSEPPEPSNPGTALTAEPEFDVTGTVRTDLTAAAEQARAPKGAPGSIGGEFIDTPNGILHELGWAGEAPGTPAQAYTAPVTHPPDWDASRMRSALTERMPVSQFTDEERKAVEEYTMNAFTNVNTIKRGGPDNLTQKQEAWGQDVAGRLDGMLAKSVTPGDLYVYRGAGRRLPRGVDADSLVGQVISDKAYLSTSIDPLTGNQFSEGAVIKIAVPKGTHAIWADRMSLNEGEMEMILPPSTPLAITGVDHETYIDWKGDTRDRSIIHAVVANPASLTAAAEQVRAAKGTPIGGQWIDTPTGILDNLEGADRRAAKRWGGKGPALDFTDAAADPLALQNRVNPGSVDGDKKEFKQNCTRVAFATEMQARGYPNAVAPPFFNDFPTYQPDMERKWQSAPDGTSRYFQNVTGGDFGPATANDPPGSRYWVTASFQKGGAHVWNAEKQADGSLLHIDAQTGQAVRDFSKVPLLSVIRVDDLEPTFAAVKGSNDTGEPAMAMSREELARTQGATP